MKYFLAILIVFTFGHTALADEPSTLSTNGLPTAWLQGEKIENWEKDKLYLLEFWATWCGPCIASIPHIEEMHLHYKDDKNVQIVGINVFDTKSPGVIKEFLAGLGTPPTYTIAIDTDKRTAEQWLKPLNVSGIPFSCAVRNSRIIWKGHPKDLSVETIALMKNPEFTLADLEKKLPKVASKEETDALKRDLITATASNNFAEVDRVLENILTMETLTTETKWRAFVNTGIRCFAKAQPEKGNHYFDRTIDAFPDQLPALARVAHFLNSNEDIPLTDRDLAVAEKSLLRCIELSDQGKGNASMYWDKLADTELLRGNFEKAFDHELNALKGMNTYKSRTELYEKLGKEAPELSYTVKSDKIVRKEVTLIEPFLLAPETPKAEGPDAAKANELLGKADWLRGGLPFLPAGKPVFIEMWVPQRRGGTMFMAYNRIPGNLLARRLGNAGIRPDQYYNACISLSSRDKANNVAVLGYSYNQNPVPVAYPGETLEECMEFFMQEHHNDYPTVAVFADGSLIWKGTTRRLPLEVIEHAFSGNKDHEQFRKAYEAEQVNQKKAFEYYKQIMAAYQTDDMEMVEATLEKMLEASRNSANFTMMAVELQVSPYYETENYEKIIETFTDCLDRFPSDVSMANQIFKSVKSDIELAKPARELILRCANIAINHHMRIDPDYTAAWYTVVADVEEKSGNYEAAIEATEKALATCWYGVRLKAIGNGEIPLQK